MKKIFFVLMISLMLASVAFADTEFTYHLQGGQGDGSRVVGVIFDETGQHVQTLGGDLSKEVCKTYTARVRGNKSKICMIWRNLDWGWNIPLNVSILDVENLTHVNVSLPKYNVSENESSIGYCGDGKINGIEVCDGNKGCKKPTPVCKNCISCVCGSNEDCGESKPWYGPCGYGSCSDEEKPMWTIKCVYGVCMPSYTCVTDPECIKKKICKPGYATQQECEAACKDPMTEKCYYNHKTDCWDCLELEVVVHDLCEDTEQEDCMLDPSMLGASVPEGAEPDEINHEFLLDGVISDDEAEILEDIAQDSAFEGFDDQFGFAKDDTYVKVVYKPTNKVLFEGELTVEEAPPEPDIRSERIQATLDRINLSDTPGRFILGNPKINMEVLEQDGSISVYGFRIKGDKAGEYVEGGHEKPHYIATLTAETLDVILDAEEPEPVMGELHEAGEIELEPQTVGAKMRSWFANLLAGLFRSD